MSPWGIHADERTHAQTNWQEMGMQQHADTYLCMHVIRHVYLCVTGVPQ